MCVKRAGFDPKTISTHTIRKAFRKIVRQTNIDDDDKEQLMGHVIPGSRQAYYDKKDVDLIRDAYFKCNFTREAPESEVTKLRKEVETQRDQLQTIVNGLSAENLELKSRVARMELSQTRFEKHIESLDSTVKRIRETLEKVAAEKTSQ